MVDDAFRRSENGLLGQADFAAWAREHNTVRDIISFLIRERKTVACPKRHEVVSADPQLTLDKLLRRAVTESSATCSSMRSFQIDDRGDLTLRFDAGNPTALHSRPCLSEFDIAQNYNPFCTTSGDCNRSCLRILCQGCHYFLWVSYCLQCGARMGQHAAQLSCDSCRCNVQCNFCFHCGRSFIEKVEPVFGHRANDLARTTVKGYLWKLGKIFRKVVKRRWCVIQGNFLHTFHNRKSVGPSHVICLHNCYAEPLSERSGRSRLRWGLQLYTPINNVSRVFFCETQDDRDRWIEALRNAARQTDLEEYYQIEEEIGSGRFSKVYRCRRREDNEVFALKVIDKSSVGESLRPLLRNEVVIHQFVHHRNIVSLKNVFETQTRIQLIMPCIPGGDLYQRLTTKGPYSEPKARSIFTQILTALQYLHERGIVHRDLKLENIMIASKNRDDEIQLVDFGLSKFTAPDQTMVRPCGTLVYAAPEILLKNGYGREVDAWSAGVVLYSLLSARLPFCVSDLRQAGDKILNCNYVLDGDVWSGVSDSAKDLIRSLLQPQPNLRLTIRDALKHPWLESPSPDWSSTEPNRTDS